VSSATRLIVLGTTKVGESSIVVHTLSEEYGRRGFIASVSRKSGMALFLPFNILEAEVVENRKSDLWRLRDISSCHPLDGIRSNVYKNPMTLFMSEVLFRTLRDGANEEGLFQWCERSILTLDALESDFSNFHLRWLLELCAALGFRASTEDLAPFAGERLKDIRNLCAPTFSEALMTPLSGPQRSEIASILLDYLSFHTETKINVRSLAVLGELFR